MTAYVALLRGVNLGKRSVKSAELVKAFEALGFSGVKTLIASGNVLFEAKGSEAILRKRIEAALEAHFGFDIGTVLRSRDELRAMVKADPFGGGAEDDDHKLYVTFLAEEGAKTLPRNIGVPGDFEVVKVTEREVFMIGHRQPSGRFSEGMAAVGKHFGKQVLWTNRNWNTIVKAAG
jgi:uncharacterized protein (DUF1697 family)